MWLVSDTVALSLQLFVRTSGAVELVLQAMIPLIREVSETERVYACVRAQDNLFRALLKTR